MDRIILSRKVISNFRIKEPKWLYQPQRLRCTAERLERRTLFSRENTKYYTIYILYIYIFTRDAYVVFIFKSKYVVKERMRERDADVWNSLRLSFAFLRRAYFGFSLPSHNLIFILILALNHTNYYLTHLEDENNTKIKRSIRTKIESWLIKR